MKKFLIVFSLILTLALVYSVHSSFAEAENLTFNVGESLAEENNGEGDTDMSLEEVLNEEEGNTGDEENREEEPAFKGMDLYSWQEEGSDKWYFSILPGTNRLKTYEEVVAEDGKIEGLEELKKRISSLPIGESLFWTFMMNNDIPEDSVSLGYPPKEIITEISDLCKELEIELYVPECSDCGCECK